ncbi:MAG: S-methyl-5'-thioadenosine phosphorylase [Dehalococcoidia bacterium]
MTNSIPLAVIGGSGFYDMPGLSAVEEVVVDTPFGPTSDSFRIGTLEGERIAFLARHGRGHTLLPSELPQRANFWAMKHIGVQRVLSVSAVGSLRQDYRPGHLVTPHQIIDRTRGLRPSTFFGNGVVAHIGFAEPFCPSMRTAARVAAETAGAHVHRDAVYVVMEGPAFSTRAESELHRTWRADLIGMTALPEAKLAREAEICYAMLAAVTDYDAWQETHTVDATGVFETLSQNVATAQKAVRELAKTIPGRDHCECASALDSALVTNPEAIDNEARERLRPILARRLGQGA